MVWGSDMVCSRACCGAEHGVRENVVLNMAGMNALEVLFPDARQGHFTNFVPYHSLSGLLGYQFVARFACMRLHWVGAGFYSM